MKNYFVGFHILLMICLVAMSAWADERTRLSLGDQMIHGGSPGFAKAGGDTINLMSTHDDPTNGAGEPYYFGDFEDADGNPAWNGWTHRDITQPRETHWNVSNYNQPDTGNHAAWCGDITIAACNESDPAGGYGNSWHDIIEFRQVVPHPESSTTVTITATLIHDSEPGYDYTYLSYRFQAQLFGDLQSWDGAGTEAVEGSVTFLPLEYLDGTDIAVYFRFKSDGGWSDEDCSYTTAGACQVDDINVHLVNGPFTWDFFEDFEHDGDPVDFGLWSIAFPDGVGDFARIWKGLQDVDPCVSNFSPQVAFIDDGLIVPGTGGSDCINWCYGPGGYIVTTTGGLAGPAEHIHCAIESPVMAWPASQNGGQDDDGIIIAFGVFRHEDLDGDSPGIFYTWGIRSADTDGSGGPTQDIYDQGWQDRAFVYYGDPGYVIFREDVTDLMNSGRDEVQVQLAVYEVGWIWNYLGNDGYPAPYYDNVRVKVFPYAGPGMSARELDMAQDNFPERGTIDTGDLGSHSVRFDMANSISLAADLRNDPGDTMVVDINPVRAGAEFLGNPLLRYTVRFNPVFDPYRSAGMPAVGSAMGMPSVGSSGTWTPGKWAFDLPDTGFLFPGDVLHYYIEATDAIDGTDPQTSLMPADTTGFSTGFGDPIGYNSRFVIHALPSIVDNGFGGFEQPEILFINDFGNRGGENKWYTALRNSGGLSGLDYDVYYVNGPSSGVGNGIGGRANHLMLAGYETILYTSGDLRSYTLSNGDFTNDPGNDVETLTNWLDSGGKNIFLTGDGLATNLSESGTETLVFLEEYMGLDVVTDDIRSLIHSQVAPLVVTTDVLPVDEVFYSLSSWYAYGGCPGLNRFDGVVTRGGAIRLAEFTDPQRQPGAYPFAAATLNRVGDSRVISMPVDLMFVYTDPEAPAALLSSRTRVLRDVLSFFGYYSPFWPSEASVPGPIFQVSNHPNPFNPSTTILYSLPRAGHLKLNIYNVRGQLVKTLIDEARPAGEDQSVFWDGKDNRGSSAASGVYFYEARAAGEVKLGKMTLLK